MAGWIVIVDDDVSNLKMAGHILSRHNLRVTALRSGMALLSYVEENRPDLILLDIKMPEMDGFETLERLRAYEKQAGLPEIPVVFLTSADDSETKAKGFEMGVSDYIKKPFIPEILIRRLDGILTLNKQYEDEHEENSVDPLTGFLNKQAMISKLTVMLQKRSGYLMLIDLDSFKRVNDIYGMKKGDEYLIAFADLIRKNVGAGSVIARTGGDEFMVFTKMTADESYFQQLSTIVNTGIVQNAKNILGNDLNIPVGASIGITYVSGISSDYVQAYKEACSALEYVKKNGKHGYAIYRPNLTGNESGTQEMDLKGLSGMLSEQNVSNRAMLLDQDTFLYVYQFAMRYIKRYNRNACRLLFTLSRHTGVTDAVFKDYCEQFSAHLTSILRKSDLIMRSRQNQFLVLLTDIRENAISQMMGSLLRGWEELHNDDIVVSYETEYIGMDSLKKEGGEALWVVVVDDDPANLKMAGHILSKNGIHVTALRSGKALLDFVQKNRPDLILLDVAMPEMDGFETMEHLRTQEESIASIPVIFLTGEDSGDSEARALGLGAMDFIRKPFTPNALTLRIRQIVELMRLQQNLSVEVAKKTRDNEALFIHVVQALADAIDAKDSYTNGHSERVASYSREIAKRYGYNESEQNDIYIMGLLHDVGKIGVPDEVINKPARLTPEEFEKIKVHPAIGARILDKIEEMPKLAVGAHWHHERMDGTGYPYGLSGEMIPEEARIIAVADAYDAMTSYRSYRDPLTQERVLNELENGKGTQFDPRFADIMIRMISEDKDYEMREKH